MGQVTNNSYHIIGCNSSEDTRVYNSVDDVARTGKSLGVFAGPTLMANGATHSFAAKLPVHGSRKMDASLTKNM